MLAVLLWSMLGLMLFLLLALVLGFLIAIPSNRSSKNPAISIFLMTNGFHTSFLFPARSDYFDWWEHFKMQDFENSQLGSWLEAGWGDRGFYLETPTWDDLKYSVAARALLLPTPSLLFVTCHDSPEQVETVDREELPLSEEQYHSFCEYILKTISTDKNGYITPLYGQNYTPNDHFYPSSYAYHALYTCNVWTHRGLKNLGFRSPLWSPVYKGIFYHLRK